MPGAAAYPRHCDSGGAGGGTGRRSPRLQAPHPGPVLVGRRSTEHPGEEPRGVHGVAAVPVDHDVVDLPLVQGPADRRDLGRRRRGLRVAEQGQVGQDPAGRSGRTRPDRAAQGVGCLQRGAGQPEVVAAGRLPEHGLRGPRDGEGDREQHRIGRKRRRRLAHVGGRAERHHPEGQVEGDEDRHQRHHRHDRRGRRADRVPVPRDHDAGRRCATWSASSPTASRKATKSVSNGANWSGRISLRRGRPESSRQGSHGWPIHAGAPSRYPPSASHSVTAVKKRSSHVRGRRRAATTAASAASATPPPT